MIKYTTEIPNDVLDKYCRTHMISISEAVTTLRESGIGACENEINNLLTDVYKMVFIYFMYDYIKHYNYSINFQKIEGINAKEV